MTIDGMEPFVKATYVLEGDGLLAFIGYERISALYSHVASNHHPNVTAVAKHLANGNSTNEQILVTYADNSVQPTYEYFKAKFDNDLSNALQLLKQQGTSLLQKISKLKPTTSDLDSLQVFPFLDSEAIEGLKSELPNYLAATEDSEVSSQFDILEWWKHHKTELPTWTSVCRQVVLIQPSSAASEHVSLKFAWKTTGIFLRRLYPTVCNDAIQLS